MNRIKCVIAYDGTHFQGYQVQPNKRTVQGEVEKILQSMHKGEAVRIYASGRTDATVHAKGQVIHFDSPLNLNSDAWKRALNTQLPDDIAVESSEITTPDFHARFASKGKEYHYHVYTGQERDPFTRHHAYHFPYPLNKVDMKKAMESFLGTHDFTSFCSAKTEIEDRVRTIEAFQLIENNDQELIFQIRGNGFLYNMVRIIVGTVLEVGTGRRKAEEIVEILEAKDRTKAGKTAPGHGLYLWKVYY